VPILISKVKSEASQLIEKMNNELQNAARLLFQEIEIKQKKIREAMNNPDSSLEKLIEELGSFSFSERPITAFSEILAELLSFKPKDSLNYDSPNASFSSTIMEPQNVGNLSYDFGSNDSFQASPVRPNSPLIMLFDEKKRERKKIKATKTMDFLPFCVSDSQDSEPKTFNQLPIKQKIEMLKKEGIKIEDEWHVLQARKSNDNNVVIVCK
jgi:hypothetical protein